MTYEGTLEYLRNLASGIGSFARDTWSSLFSDEEMPSGGVTMPIPDDASPLELSIAKDFLKDEESFSSKPYSDYAQMSIGYGTKAKEGDKRITREEALQRMHDHLTGTTMPQVQSMVSDEVWSSLSPKKRAALLSLVYNVGPTAFRKSRALEALNSGDEATFLQEAFDEEKGFVNVTSKGKPQRSRGLQRRRGRERDELWK